MSNIFILREGVVDPPSLNIFSDQEKQMSANASEKVFDPTACYGAWLSANANAMEFYELFNYMNRIIPQEHLGRVKIIIHEGIIGKSTIGWKYTPYGQEMKDV